MTKYRRVSIEITVFNKAGLGQWIKDIPGGARVDSVNVDPTVYDTEPQAVPPELEV